MTSPLDNQIKKSIAKAFRGKLKTGFIQANQPESLDDFGDVVPPDTPVQYKFTGIRDNFDAMWMKMAGIPEKDVRVLILLGSVLPVYTPVQDDLIFIENSFHKVRRILKIDPAGASIELQCYPVAPGG